MSDSEPTPSDVERLPGRTLLEFGTAWCGHCRAAQPLIGAALQQQTAPPAHLQIEDGPGRRLGRHYGVKLWPTLVLLQDGREIGRLVRPREQGPIAQLLATAA